MKTPCSLLTASAAFILAVAAHAQPAPGAKPAAPGTPPAGAPAKGKPFSPADKKAYVSAAEAMQFQLNMALRLHGKYKDGDPAILAFAGKIRKESTDLYTPGVDIAMAHGLDNKLIPQDMTKNDKAALTKIGQMNKDDKKWELAFFEHYAKEAKKNAHDAEGAQKGAQDPDLKAWLEKAVTLLKSQADAVEAKFKEVKAKK